MNFINIAGHLGADPEVRYTSSGKKVLFKEYPLQKVIMNFWDFLLPLLLNYLILMIMIW